MTLVSRSVRYIPSTRRVPMSDGGRATADLTRKVTAEELDAIRAEIGALVSGSSPYAPTVR
ncbi:hypothetical protein DLE01_19450 [Streptomyces sp. FT05W]|nr:hypothetical protein DLE01_19450 [Streptomyces sp. FT05W]